MKLTAVRVLLTSVVGLGLAIASHVQPANANEYSEDFRRTYIQACQTNAQRAGLEAGVAAQICQCTLSRLQERFSEAELQRVISGNTAEATAARQKLTEIGSQCALDVLN
ncbi:MAG: hypothetical protein HC910_19905 [Spirulinaceae cyanobacterium SM2_1_0]|nr:hypothetical protein [Spirulinaceae cyanobacterium SM2_1_0]